MNITEWAMLPFIATGAYCAWRMYVAAKASERIQIAQRRHIAELKRAVARTKEIDAQRTEINTRYAQIIEEIRAHWNLDKEEE